jgi:putative membrane protein insertion efficiency factor
MQADDHGRNERPGAAQRILLALIRGYQLLFAPMYTGSCRFTPSCSAYAAEAVQRFGALRGARLAAGRLARCHPFGGHGHDPVPASAPPALRRGKPTHSH